MTAFAVGVLWCVVLGSGSAGLWTTARRNHTLRLAIPLIAAAALSIRLLPVASFYGLEYEDAYVYAAAAKLRTASERFQGGATATLSVCAVGALEDCVEFESYPGHLIGYPVLLEALHGVLGLDWFDYPIIGALIGTATALLVCWTCFALFQSAWAAVCGSVLFATTPTLALYGGSAVSETASSFSVVAWCGALAEAVGAHSGTSHRRWSALAVSCALLAAMVRRENAILLPLTIAVLIRLWWHELSHVRRAALVAMGLTVAMSVLAIGVRSLASEVGEYGAFSFSLARLVETSIPIAGALVQPAYFGALSWIALLGVVVAALYPARCGAPRANVVVLCSALIILMWLLSYAAHVRSTYQLAGFPVSSFDYLRYLSNAGGLMCVLAGVPVALLHGKHRVPLTAALVLLGGLGWLGSIQLRGELVDAEWRNRFAPAIAARELALETEVRVPILTLEPLVQQLVSPSNSFVVGLPSLTRDHVHQLGGEFIYVEHDTYNNEVDHTRYAHAIAQLPSERHLLRSGDGWRIWRLSAPGEDQVQ